MKDLIITKEDKRRSIIQLRCISDGMAQSHTSCPWLGNVNSVNKPLEQKILGIIDHGRNKFTQFRVFPSFSGNTNLNIHAFLLNLEDWRTEMGEGLHTRIK